jgi:hypothetical protein
MRVRKIRQNETQKHCNIYRAVHIEISLREESPESGNIARIGWRLSAISLRLPFLRTWRHRTYCDKPYI